MKAIVLNNAGWFLIGAGVGIALGGYFAKRQAEKEYYAKLDSELDAARKYYLRFTKRDEYSDPTDLVAKSSKNDPETAESVSTDDEIPETPNVKVVSKNTDYFDYRREIPKRASKIAYVISLDEYEENPKAYDQRTLTYYSKDDVLVEDYDTPIDHVVGVVGEDALDQFGNGSKDPNLVYVRNDRLAMDFEICYDPGSFEETVLGKQIKHGDSRKVPKFRIDDD